MHTSPRKVFFSSRCFPTRRLAVAPAAPQLRFPKCFPLRFPKRFQKVRRSFAPTDPVQTLSLFETICSMPSIYPTARAKRAALRTPSAPFGALRASAFKGSATAVSPKGVLHLTQDRVIGSFLAVKANCLNWKFAGARIRALRGDHQAA